MRVTKSTLVWLEACDADRVATSKSNPSAPAVPAPNAMLPIDFDHDDYAPSRQTLLRRAAELGPTLTWSSIPVSADPVLGAKMLPRVVERRARLRRVVQIALAACAACCLVASVASAFSSTPSSAAGIAGRSVAKTEREKLEVSAHAKADRHAVARPAAKLAKRR